MRKIVSPRGRFVSGPFLAAALALACLPAASALAQEEVTPDAECEIACAEVCDGDPECRKACALECIDGAGEPELACPEEKVAGCDKSCASHADPDACFAQCLSDAGCLP